MEDVVPSPRLRPGGSAPEPEPGLGFAKNPTSPLPSAFGSASCGGFAAVAGGSDKDVIADETAGGLIRRERFGRLLCNIARRNCGGD